MSAFNVKDIVFAIGKLAVVIIVIGLLFAFIKRKEVRKAICSTAIVMVVAYFVLALLGGRWIWAVFEPYVYFSLRQVTILYILSAVAGMCCLDINWLIISARKKTFDTLLAILSFIIPLVGLILCIVYRAKKDKDVPASNVYLAAAVLPGLLGVFCTGVLSIIGVM